MLVIRVKPSNRYSFVVVNIVVKFSKILNCT